MYPELQPRQGLVPGLAPVSICHPLPCNSLRIRTSAAHSDVRETKDLQAQEFIDNSFVIYTYERPSEVRETQGL